MKRVLSFATAIVLVTAACGRPAGTLDAAREALSVETTQSISYAGTGRWYQFGQSPAAPLPWPPFDVSSFSAAVDYQTPAARVQMTRTQVVEAGRVRPAPIEQRVDQYVSGTSAWNVPPAGGNPTPQPAAVEERTMEIWTTPHGFLRAAAANAATSEPADGGARVSFTAGGHRYVGTISAESDVTRVESWIDNPVTGDTHVVTTYGDYRDFGGVRFPARVVRTQGGHPLLDLTVTQVTANPTVSVPVPASAAGATVPPVTATIEALAPGVHYVRGGSHHSVVVEQQDHLVVIEAPQNEARSLAVIAVVKAAIPGKPIRYVVNTHHHFDHSGGLRSYVDEGATIVTHESNRAFYETAWAAPRSLNPDRLARSRKTATFETVADQHVLSDGKRRVEIHRLAGNGHNDGFLAVYLPGEKILVQVDAWAPTAAGTPPPMPPSPFAVNLLENIQRLKLDVARIAALHGPGIATMADFRAALGPAATAASN